MATKDSKYECLRCGWIYDPAEGDPEGGIAPGTPFKDIPNNWKCPVCGASKSDFAEYPENKRVLTLTERDAGPKVPKGPHRRREIPPIGVADVSLLGLGSP